MPLLPSPVLRGLEGLVESSGRTVAIVGPPMSGKSALLEEIRGLLQAQGARVVSLRGSYRSRSVPYGALDGLRADTEAEVTIPEEAAAEPTDSAELTVPVAPVPYLTERLPRSRRSRGERARTTYLGQPVRARSANEGDPDAYWQEILPEMRGPEGNPVVILIDDGALFDTESREFVVALSKRARFRPFLIVVALDSSVPGFITWEEAFLGRGDVDWVRLTESHPDPREAHRLKAIFDDLPSASQRVAGYVSLLGGSVGEVALTRVSRLTFSQLGEAIVPAAKAGLLKVVDGKVTIPHAPWVPLPAELLPEQQRQEMHLEIANALSALSPEPNLARRIEVARHYLAWYPGPMALRHLLEAAEISLELLAFDSAEELLNDAIGCLQALPPAQRDIVEPELRLLHARALFSAGRVTQAESEVREGLDGALRAKIAAETLAGWVEPLLLTMRVVGPRPSLATTLLELIERCHDAEMVEIEVLFEALVAEFHTERGWPEKARHESDRAAVLARKLPEGHLQALALLAVGLSRIEGNADDQELAGRFLHSARHLFGRTRRWELDALAEDLEARLLQARGESERAREVRERSIPALQRNRLISLELYQQLGIAEILLDQGASRAVEQALERAHTIAENLHLLPPSPALLRLWLLEGRQAALNDLRDPARDRWEAIVEEAGPTTIPRIRAETVLRLALLEYPLRPDRAEELAARLREPELSGALPRGASSWIGQLDRLAPASENGGGPLPSPAEPEPSPSRERRERPRRKSVEDRKGPHHG